MAPLAERWHALAMQSRAPKPSRAIRANGRPAYAPTDAAEKELRAAVAELERGEYLTLTPEQVASWTESGDFPWPDESRD